MAVCRAPAQFIAGLARPVAASPGGRGIAYSEAHCQPLYAAPPGHLTAMPPSIPSHAPTRWQRLSAATVRGFHAYASWLVGISWRRFFVLALLLMLASAVLQNIPPFSWDWTYTTAPQLRSKVVEFQLPPAAPATPASPASSASAASAAPAATPAPSAPSAPSGASGLPAQRPKAAVEPGRPGVHIAIPDKDASKPGVAITIDEKGVRIVPQPAPASASSATSAAGPAKPLFDIRVPEGPAGDGVREAIEEARQAVLEAVDEARREAESAKAEVGAARDEVQAAKAHGARARAEARRAMPRVHRVSLGEHLPSLAMLWIVLSIVLKITYRQQKKAEAQAARAVETAESESLRRQVVEARMAAMQAQIEPHFLFNTLASIDHLIEVDPHRASQMQKNLIALLRASMPSMREADGGVPRDLGRELSVIRPYLDILQARMEERLNTQIDVPEGLLSAEFPAMMVQTLVENAIKHGLEPKPEGGHLLVKAEIVHGKLVVTVADTGLGFGRAATAGTGVGLANIRERLQLLYGAKAALTIAENPGGGTRVSVSVPYKPVESSPR